MTEQQLIKTVEEALEAEKQGRLILGSGEEWEISSMQLNEAVAMVKTTKELFWKPTEYEYVTMESFRLDRFLEGGYEIKNDADVWQWVRMGLNWDTDNIERLLEANRLRRKKAEGGGEIELVEAKTNHHNYPVIYIPTNHLTKGEEFTYSVSDEYFSFCIPVKESERRTVKGVIHEE